MIMEEYSFLKGESEQRGSRTVEDILSSISVETWKAANWPVVTYSSKASFNRMSGNEVTREDDRQEFWCQIFDSKRFFSSKRDNGYDPKKHFLFVLHSFRGQGGDTLFKAVTTSEKFLFDNEEYIINYNHHGRPCENRGGGSYPTYDFYDETKNGNLLNRSPIPDTEWREKFVKENFN